MIALMIVLGVAAGYLSLLFSRRLIRSRVGKLPENKLVSRKIAPVIWCIISAAGYTVIYLAAGSVILKAEYAAVFTLCMCISAVDWVIKKIPNSLLLR